MWFRRDLRMADNPALLAAAAAARREGVGLTAAFVLDPALVTAAGANRIAFLAQSLTALRRAVVPLVVRQGDPRREIPKLAAELDAPNVFCTGDFSPHGMRRDREAAGRLAQAGRRLVEVASPYAVEPGTLTTQAGGSFQVFTPFHRVWLDHAGTASPDVAFDPGSVAWRDVSLGEIPEEPAGAAPRLPKAGEAAAWERWQRFEAEHLDDYALRRNLPGADATSRLSVDLKFGAIHPRQLLPALAGSVKGSGRWVFRSELAWREFYAEVLWRRPDTVTRNYVLAMDRMRVDTGRVADARFEAWCQGRTGFPFIDAGMRQLLAEGWMHNRVRMVVASFLVKDLHLAWQRGAAWFMEHLVDGDIASNQHGWQWTAGTGTDAAPYFRVFNPTSQGRTFDPDGTYIRRYVPELADFDGDVHEPHRGVGIGGLFHSAVDYPSPIVDHAAERAEALARLAELRN